MKTTKDDQFTSQSRTLPFIDRFMSFFFRTTVLVYPIMANPTY